MKLPLWAFPEHPGILVELEPRPLELLDDALGELAPGIIRRMFSKEPAEQVAAARQGEAYRENQLSAERAVIHCQMFCICSRWRSPRNGPSVKRIHTGEVSMKGRVKLACIMSSMAMSAMTTLLAWSAVAETISGPVRPMDGNTFEMAGVGVIRLADIDAPEMAQKCEGGPKELRDCGAYAADVLAERIRGQTVECEVDAIDEYQRRIASCGHAGEDLSTWLVSEGLALAFRRYSQRLVPLEEAAKAAGRGLWQTTFEAPWDYRAHRWEAAAQEAPGGCAIKGNINRDGERIYHTPWGSQWYERTKITESKGERWFCDEAQALAAGWRAPLR